MQLCLLNNTFREIDYVMCTVCVLQNSKQYSMNIKGMCNRYKQMVQVKKLSQRQKHNNLLCI